jgi:putative SOS response-associated peptidase YedK
MCSRYSLTSPHEAVRATFGTRNGLVFPPRYNIAPTQPVAIVRLDHKGEREMELVRWGLVPSWAKDASRLPLLINARAETALDKPTFRAGLRYRRCLVPADAFYEWGGAKGRRRPHMVRKAGGGPMALAGISEHWLGADGSELDSMAVLTVAANAEVSRLHDRMPAILPAEQFSAWLDCRGCPAEEAADMLGPAPDASLEIAAVSQKLNNWRNDGPEVQQPAGTDELL